jgi:hypothetical protein
MTHIYVVLLVPLLVEPRVGENGEKCNSCKILVKNKLDFWGQVWGKILEI